MLSDANARLRLVVSPEAAIRNRVDDLVPSPPDENHVLQAVRAIGGEETASRSARSRNAALRRLALSSPANHDIPNDVVYQSRSG